MTSNFTDKDTLQFKQTSIFLDPILVGELSNPGSDLRFGVNIIAHLPQDIQDQIGLIQQSLKQVNPNQYYYPAGDLHLTLLEICSSRPRAEVDAIASTISEHITSILEGINSFPIRSPALVGDRNGCALSFENNAPYLSNARKQLINRVRDLGIDYQPRYFPKSAHITLMRYINTLNLELDAWIRHLVLTPINTGLVWNIDAFTVSWGATWYGMQSRINKAGPYGLR